MVTWLTVRVTVTVVVAGIERLANSGTGGSRPPGGTGGAGAFGELVDVFQPTHAQLTMELDRQRLDIVQSPAPDPRWGVDLDAGIATYVPRDPAPHASGHDPSGRRGTD